MRLLATEGRVAAAERAQRDQQAADLRERASAAIAPVARLVESVWAGALAAARQVEVTSRWR